MARVRTRARHRVEFTVPALALRKSDIVFTVLRDAEIVGKLFVSRGALVWYSRNGKLGRKLSWSRFDTIAQEHGARVTGS
ncbi:MAG: hypothetical protein ABI577_17855 [bacterium]